MQERASLRGAVSNLEGTLRDAKNEIDNLSNRVCELSVGLNKLKDEADMLKGWIAEIEEGVAIPEATRRRVQRELFVSTRWVERQQLIARESTCVVRDEVLWRFPDMDLSFLVARLGEKVSEEGSTEVKEDDVMEIVANGVKAIADNGGERADGSAPGECDPLAATEE